MLYWLFYLKLFAYLPITLSSGPHHPHGGHVHKLSNGDVPSHKETRFTQNVEHVKEELEGVVSPEATANMTYDELRSHFMKIHDADENGKLDGLEMLWAIQHESDRHNEKNNLDEIVKFIDEIFAEDDLNNDGYLSYVELASISERYDRDQQQPSGNSVSF